MADVDWKKVLDTTSDVLGVLKMIANTPGINLIPYVNVAASAITALDAAVQAGRNIGPYVDAITSTFGSGSKIPTEAEVAALDQKIAELEAEIQKPLPPPDDGEPE